MFVVRGTNIAALSDKPQPSHHHIITNSDKYFGTNSSHPRRRATAESPVPSLANPAARRIKSCGAACKVYTQVANIHTKIANICTVLANIHSQVAFIVYAPGNAGLCAVDVRLACHPAQSAHSISARDVVARVVVHRPADGLP